MAHHTGFFADPESWVAIAFILFVLLFGWKLWSALTGVLDRRTNTVRAELDEAAQLKAEAAAMLRDASARRDAALAEADALLRSAHDEAQRLAAASQAEADITGRRRERMAMDRIAAAEKAATAEIRGVAAEIATQAAMQIISAGLTAEKGAPLVDQAIAALPAAFQRRAA